MNGTTHLRRSPPRTKSTPPPTNGNGAGLPDSPDMMKKKSATTSFSAAIGSVVGDAYFLKWTAADILGVPRQHPALCGFAASLFFFMAVEYTLSMIPETAAPFDLGFVATKSLHRLLSASPAVNTVLAGLNTVFVGMQTGYILWAWLIEGRPRATISALYMFTTSHVGEFLDMLHSSHSLKDSWGPARIFQLEMCRFSCFIPVMLQPQL